MLLCFAGFVIGRWPHELGLELVLGHTGLLCADVLHVQPEDAGELGQVVGVAAGGQHLQHLAGAHRVRLLGRERVLAHVAFGVGQKGVAVGLVVEGEAHLVQRITLAGHGAVERGGAGDGAGGRAHGVSCDG
jgi:hypothetical protein